MPDKIVWSNEMREEAKKAGASLVAFGVESDEGRFTLHSPGLCDEEAWPLARFIIDFVSNRKPLEFCIENLRKNLKEAKKNAEDKQRAGEAKTVPVPRGKPRLGRKRKGGGG